MGDRVGGGNEGHSRADSFKELFATEITEITETFNKGVLGVLGDLCGT